MPPDLATHRVEIVRLLEIIRPRQVVDSSLSGALRYDLRASPISGIGLSSPGGMGLETEEPG